MNILHVVPKSLFDPKQKYSGSTKDICGRIAYFESRNVDYEQIISADRSDVTLLPELQKRELGLYSALFLEYTLYPKSLAYVRRVAPTLKVISRSINAELYHRLHLAVSILRHRGWHFARMALSPVIESLSRLKSDWVSGRLSDYILPITTWEQKNYWAYLTHPAKIRTLPYFLPSVYANETPFNMSDKTNTCVCLLSNSEIPSSFMADVSRNFVRLAKQIGTQGADWQFIITGKTDIHPDSLPANIKLTDLLPTPFEVLKTAKAVAVLTNYGFGFKTKILEAIVAGCYVLVPPELFNRLPKEIRPFCKIVPLHSPTAFVQALHDCQMSWPSLEANSALRQQAFKVLDSILTTPLPKPG